MPTLTFVCGWEDAAVTTHWNDVGGVSALDSTIAGRTGTNAARIDITNVASQQRLRATWTARAENVASFRFRFSALPTTNQRVARFLGGAYDVQLLLGPAGELVFTIGVGQVLSANLSVDTWYRIDMASDATNKLARWAIDGVAQTNPTNNGGAATTHSDIGLGKTQAVASGAMSYWFDDVAVSGTFADYPIGAGSVLGSPETWYPPITGAAAYAAPVSTWDALATNTDPFVPAGPGGAFILGPAPDRTPKKKKPQKQKVAASARFAQQPAAWDADVWQNDDELVLEMLARG